MEGETSTSAPIQTIEVPNEALCQALEKGVKELASGEALVSGFQGDKDRATLLKALLSMNFVKDGL